MSDDLNRSGFSVVRAWCSENEIANASRKGLLSVRFYRFDIMDNGFDPAILTPEQREEERGEPWTYVIGVRHAGNGRLKDRYDSLEDLIGDVHEMSLQLLKEKYMRKLRDERRA
ncbi:MAG: hypothetical protein IKO41_17780 [Lachnospiraceae bacterium]|nr:hypothetical protein [Lachnospiraceae bacterium]